MNYPVWEIGIGGGVLIALVSILHVFVSHFAIGGGLWLVLNEIRAHRTGDTRLREFVKTHSRFFMLLTLVFGAISGVGIWATIGLVNPQAVSALVHAYVFGWAMEWVFFFVEIAAAIVYYYGWEKLTPGRHQLVGWIYFISAWMSLFIINGIITFMLTPGGWLETHGFWTGFFNPTFWPSLLIRTFGALAIAGIFALLTAARLPRDEFRWARTREGALWVLISMGGVLAGAMWYRGAVGVWDDALLGAIPVLPLVGWIFTLGLVSTLAVAVWPLLAPKLWHPVGVALLILVGLGTMGSGEWMREAGRKPFTLYNYMYSTGLRVDQEPQITEDGVVAFTQWISPAAAADETRLGRDLFLAWCQPCHTRNGYNGLEPWLAWWTDDYIGELVPRLGNMRALMPPWFGTEEEAAAVTAYLITLRPAEKPVLPADDLAAGEQAFAVSCGLCHTPFGYRALAESFTDMELDEIDEFLEESGDLDEGMPGYYGEGREREVLSQYLQHIGRAAEEGGAS